MGGHVRGQNNFNDHISNITAKTFIHILFYYLRKYLPEFVASEPIKNILVIVLHQSEYGTGVMIFQNTSIIVKEGKI
jgi:hypothetical protein